MQLFPRAPSIRLAPPASTSHTRPAAAAEPQAESRPSPAADPFEGLPLRALADRLGAAFQPLVEASNKETASRRRLKPEDVPVFNVPVPSLLPVTRWASNNEALRQTLIVPDDPAERRTRLSWYHPDDGMVPRGWFRDGLMADMAFFAPFAKAPGWKGGKTPASA